MNTVNEIEIKGIQKSFGFEVALRETNLSINKGEFVTLFGPNGAGKSTFLGILSTLIQPTAGTASICNLDIIKDKSGIRDKIGFISHSSMLYENLSAHENLTFFGTFYNLDDLDDRCDYLLKMVGLHNRRNQRVNTFSRGMKQRLSIARALLHNPRVIFLDEPFNGLDQEGIRLLNEMINNLKKSGYTTILTTHNIEEGLENASRTLILNKGYIVHDSFEKYNKKTFSEIYRSILFQ